MKDFSYYKPSTVSEAVALLAASGENRPLSGGMTLLPTMKMRLCVANRHRRSGRVARADRDHGRLAAA